MNTISHYALVALVLAGSIMASTHITSPSSDKSSDVAQPLPLTRTGHLFDLPENEINEILHRLPSMHDLVEIQRTSQAGRKATEQLLSNASKILMTALLKSDYNDMIRDFVRVRNMVISDHAHPRRRLLVLPSCFSIQTKEQRQMSIDNFIRVTTNAFFLIESNWIIIPLKDLVDSAGAKWGLNVQLGSPEMIEVDKFVKNQFKRLFGEIKDTNWSEDALHQLIYLRWRIQHHQGIILPPFQRQVYLQDAISATLCTGVHNRLKPTITATSGSITAANFRQVVDFLRNHHNAAPAWMNAAYFAVLNAGKSIRYNPLADISTCYRLKPNLRNIILGMRAHLPTENWENVTAELDSLFTFNQNHGTTTDHDAGVQFAEQLNSITNADIYLAAIKFAFLDLRLPPGFSQPTNDPYWDETRRFLRKLVHYWALESLERREGTKMAQQALEEMQNGGMIEVDISLEGLKRELAKMAPAITS